MQIVLFDLFSMSKGRNDIEKYWENELKRSKE